MALGAPRRIWAVPAIHAECGRLQALHDVLFSKIEPGDRIVYLGNYTGYGAAPRETVDEILTFRRMVLSIPGMMPGDIVYLRGIQEEMWQKLLQVHFAPNATSVLQWIFANGMIATLEGYGIQAQEGLAAAQEGVMALVRWTNKIREAVRRLPGHEIFASQQRRAAFTPQAATEKAQSAPMLFVHAGLDPSKSLEAQQGSFWWAGREFNRIESEYAPFHKVVRGFDPDHNGMRINCVTATIDGGCGFGGSLMCAGFDNKAAIFDLIEA